MESSPTQRDRKQRRLRIVRFAAIGVVASAFLTSAIVVWQRGGISAQEVAAWLDSLGALAPILFAAAFIVGLLIGLPGMVFVVGARLAFGPVAGFALAYGVGMVGLMIPFAIGRALKSNTEWQPKNRWLAKAVDLIDRRPLLAVILLRLVLWFNSPVAYALAASRLRWREYVLGCALALAPVVAAAFFATSWFL